MYEFESRVRYSEAMHTGKMNPVSVSNYFQDCAIFHSASIGKDIEYYKTVERGWFLNSWQIDICRYPSCGEKIFIATWSYGFKGLYGYRNFTICDEQRKICACANSIWFFMDTAMGQPLRVPQEEGISYGKEEQFPMEYCPRKISLPKELQPIKEYTVTHHDIDTNSHVNNARYMELAYQYLPEILQYTESIWRIRAEYKKAATLGNTICLYGADTILEAPEKTLKGFSKECFHSSELCSFGTAKQHTFHLTDENFLQQTGNSYASIVFYTK